MFRNLLTAKGRVGYDYESFYTVGSSTFTVPANVFYISAVCVGGGGGGTGSDPTVTAGAGDGGDMVHATLPVTPGETLTVIVGDGGTRGVYRGGAAGNGGSSGIKRGSTFILRAKGGQGGGDTSTLDTNIIDEDALRSGENSGGAGGGSVGGGGGAAGYSGSGGDGGDGTNGYDGEGGGGGGGAYSGQINGVGGDGGGVFLFGEGTSGDGGISANSLEAGGNGSGDASPTTEYDKLVDGQQAVGGGGGAVTAGNTGQNGNYGKSGGVRIVWPGESSFFPSSDVGAL